MPEVDFAVRWPDGRLQQCFSPSRVIEQALCPGAVYPVKELMRRSIGALEEASERVRAGHGHACGRAAAQIERLQAASTGQEGLVTVESLSVREPPVAGPEHPVVEGHHEAIVIGGGQAGLTASALLGERGVSHLVLERKRVAHSWRAERWDAFCLVTPNWQCRLPGHPYAGSDPEGFMVKEDIVAYVEDFARSIDPPILEGVTVLSVAEAQDGGLEVETTAGTATADQVVLAVGGYHKPRLPELEARLPDAVTSLHSSQYRNPASVPDGAVLVVGSGQSGAQIAEDLHLGGREVHLCVGSAPRVARFYRGRDVVAWLEDMGHYDLPIDEHPMGLQARREPNHYVTGRDGGHDLDLRAFARDGMRLHGRMLGIEGSRVTLAGDLRENLDGADATSERIKDTIDEWIDANGVDAPRQARYAPVWEPADGAGGGALDLEAERVNTVIWATGYRADWSWVRLPAFDGTGYPTHHRGVTTVPGLYVLGLPWLHTWGSGRFAGLTRDAEHVAECLAAQRRRSRQLAA